MIAALRRALRHLFTILSAISLLLCVATCVLWVRSYFVGDDITWNSRGTVGSSPANGFCDVSTGQGGLLFQELYTRDDASGSPINLRWQRVTPPLSIGGGSHLKSFWQRRGFALRGSGPMTHPGRVEQRYAAFPLWSALLFGTALSALCLWCRRMALRGDRLASGLCVVCGYDLRESSERCPECGTANPRAA